MAIYYTIDPQKFTSGEWEELAACTSLVPMAYEAHRNAKAFRRQKYQIRNAVQILFDKVRSVLYGELGDEDYMGQNASWAHDLTGAVVRLSEAIKDVIVCRKCGGTQVAALAHFDEGTGPEKGNTFAYCSKHCMETH